MEDVQRFGFVQVPVPEDLVEEVYAFLADRRATNARRGAGLAISAPDPEQEAAADDDTWDEQSLGDLLDSCNVKLRALLVLLAKRRVAEGGNRALVGAEEALNAVGLTPGRSAGGFLSRATRSSKHQFGKALPLQRDWDHDEGRWQYEVSKKDAVVILEHDATRRDRA